MKKLLLLLVLPLVFISCGEKDYSSDTYKFLAYNYAESFVKEKLKDPSSAEFPETTEKIFDITHNLTPNEGFIATYSINSWVRSKNSFGAYVKNIFSCEININDNEEISVKDLSIF